MENYQTNNSLVLLTSFDRGFYSKVNEHDEDVRREVIKCHLWFKNNHELSAFLETQRSISLPLNYFKIDKETKWADFCTMTKKEMGFKE
jgi:hypothetical protein